MYFAIAIRILVVTLFLNYVLVAFQSVEDAHYQRKSRRGLYLPFFALFVLPFTGKKKRNKTHSTNKTKS